MSGRNIYGMADTLTEEQVAVAFAMCSRSSKPFDESAQEISETRAAEFNERWVLGYGHASVAEHAVAHLAIENVSRLCADHIEDGRLSSYTEKSSRYQVIPADGWHVPNEIDDKPELKGHYRSVMRDLMRSYERTLNGLAAFNRTNFPQRANESGLDWWRRLRRESLDDARSLLPAATLTNLGLTANARSLAYLIAKLASNDLNEHRDTAQQLDQHGSARFPSLLRHAEPTPALQDQQRQLPPDASDTPLGVRMLSCQPDAENIVAEALRFSGAAMPEWNDGDAIWSACLDLDDHDQPPREFELAEYVFEVTLDYGALRELRRHRMMTLLRRPLSALGGYDIPKSIIDAGLSETFIRAISSVTDLHQEIIAAGLEKVAQYAVCHAHRQTVRVKANLRQLRNMARLRTSPKAHYGIRLPVREMMRHVQRAHPTLYDAALYPVVAVDAELHRP